MFIWRFLEALLSVLGAVVFFCAISAVTIMLLGLPVTHIMMKEDYRCRANGYWRSYYEAIHQAYSGITRWLNGEIDSPNHYNEPSKYYGPPNNAVYFQSSDSTLWAQIHGRVVEVLSAKFFLQWKLEGERIMALFPLIPAIIVLIALSCTGCRDSPTEPPPMVICLTAITGNWTSTDQCGPREVVP